MVKIVSTRRKLARSLYGFGGKKGRFEENLVQRKEWRLFEW